MANQVHVFGRAWIAMGLIRQCLLALGLVALGTASTAVAQPMDTYGLGSRSTAMAGAVTADVEDFSANYYNPAGLVGGPGVRVGVGWFGVHHDLQINGLASNVDPVHGLVTGLVVPGSIDNFRFAFGVGLHIPDDRLARSFSVPRTVPRWELYSNRPQRTFVAAHLAIEPVSWLRLGGGIAFLSTSTNRLALRGDVAFINTNGDSRLEHRAEIDLTTIRYPQAGIQIEPNEQLSFGLTYRGEFRLDTILTAEANANFVNIPNPADPSTTLAPVPLAFALETENVGAFIPMQLSLGGSFHPTDDFRVNVDMTWINWSAYQSPLGRVEVDLSVDIPPSLQGTVNLPEEIRDSLPVPVQLADRFVPRLGLEGTLLRSSDLIWRLRGGFFYEHSPLPEQVGDANLFDSDRYAMSIGTGLALINMEPLIDGTLNIDFHFQYSAIPNRTVRKTSLVDLVGDYQGSGQLFAGGLSVELAFN